VDPNWDPDSAFYLTADTDQDPGQTLLSLKVEFLHEKYTQSFKPQPRCLKGVTNENEEDCALCARCFNITSLYNEQILWF
jgi:hypothetical protein